MLLKRNQREKEVEMIFFSFDVKDDASGECRRRCSCRDVVEEEEEEGDVL